MMSLETYLATHLRYHVWATKRVLQAVAQLSPEEYLREGSNVGQRMEQMLLTDCAWYLQLAGEPPGLEEPLDDWYSIFINLESDYRTLLRKYDLLASFLEDLELALHFAHSTIHLPWLEASIPRWQALMSFVNQGTHQRGQLAGILRQLGYPPVETDMLYYFLELEGQPLPEGA